MSGKVSPPDARPSVRLALAARPENAALARRVIADEASRAGLAGPLTAAAKVVVTEGFTNAVEATDRDAEDRRRVVVQASGDEHGMTIGIRDPDNDYRPRIAERFRIRGFGLGLIAALATRVELRRLPGGGTEIEVRVGPLPGDGLDPG